MKHAILIIAYHNLDFLVEQVNKYDDDFIIFIHWDKKTLLSEMDKERLLRCPQVKVVDSVYNVNWASYGIVRATLWLCRQALQYDGVDYLHLISDADALSTSIDDFKTFFKQNSGRNFLEYNKFPYKGWEGDGWYRIKYSHKLERYNIRSNKDDDTSYKEDLNRQIANEIEKPLPVLPVYGGSAWWSLTRQCVSELLSEEQMIEYSFKEAMFPDEMFAQTVVMNSAYAGTVVNDNLRYISWGERNGSNPAVLNLSDLHGIIHDKKIFARKVEPANVSLPLLKCLTQIFHQGQGLRMDSCSDVHSIAKDLYDSYKTRPFQCGLYYGLSGTLVFLSNYAIVCPDEFREYAEVYNQMIESVCKGMLVEGCNDYESGVLGMATTLQYIRKSHIKYTCETEAVLEYISSKLVDFVLNHIAEGLDSHITNQTIAYFSAMQHSRSITPAGEGVLNLLMQFKDRCLKSSSLTMLNRQLPVVGLVGLAGNGLKLLSKHYEVPSIDWTFLFV